MNNVLQFSAIESLCGGPLLGTIYVRGRRFASANEDGKIREFVALREFLLYELYQLIAKTKENMKGERDDAIVQKGENGGGHHALEAATGPRGPLSHGLTRWSREAE